MNDFDDNAANDPDLLAAGAPKFPHPLDYVGIVGALLPFVLSLRQSSSQSSSHTVDGVVVDSQSHTQFKDYAALGGGAVAILVALVTLTWLKRVPPAGKTARIALSIGLLLVGAYQLVSRGGLLT